MATPEGLKALITQETIDLYRKNYDVYQQGMQKATAQGMVTDLNLVGINLEAPAKMLVPVLTPLLDSIPRVAAPNGSLKAQWRAVKKINTAFLRPGVAEGERNSFNSTETEDKDADYKTLEHEGKVTFEAIDSSKNFMDVRALETLTTLWTLLLSEENVVLGGQAANLGKPASVTGVASNTADGALAGGTYIVSVSALSHFGFLKNQDGTTDSKSGGAATADGESDGRNSAGVLIAGADDTITATWPIVKGAVAYNVFIDDGAAGAKRYVGMFTVNKAVITAYPVAGAAPNATDKTGSALEFTGIIGQIAASATGGNMVSQDAVALSSDGSGGIKEFNSVLQNMWNKFKLGPTRILVNAQEFDTVVKIITSSSAPIYRIQLSDGKSDIKGSMAVTSYINKYAAGYGPKAGIPQDIPINVHPTLAPGTIVFVVDQVPYPNNMIPSVWEISTLRDRTATDFALVKRAYEFGVSCREVLKGYFPAANAMIQNVPA